MTSIGLKTVANTSQVQPSKNKVAFKSGSPELKADELVKSLKAGKSEEKKGFLKTSGDKLSESIAKIPTRVKHVLYAVSGAILGEGIASFTGKTRNRVIGAVIGAVSLLGVSLSVNKSEPKK